MFQCFRPFKQFSPPPLFFPTDAWRCETNPTQQQAVSGVLAGYPVKLVRGFMVRTSIKLVMEKDGKKGHQIIILGEERWVMILNILLKRFEMYVNIHAIDVKWWMCFWIFNVLFEGRGFFENFSRRVHVECSSGREWNRMGVKSQVILPSRQEDISSFGPKNKIVWCTCQIVTWWYLWLVNLPPKVSQ